MAVEVGQKYTRKGKTFTVKKVADAYQFTYITALQDGVEDTHHNNKVFGVTAFLGEFNLMKGGKDGSS